MALLIILSSLCRSWMLEKTIYNFETQLADCSALTTVFFMVICKTALVCECESRSMDTTQIVAVMTADVFLFVLQISGSRECTDGKRYGILI